MSTDKLSSEQASRAREFEALFLTRLLSVGQKNLATSVDLSESAISNWKKEGIIERFCKALAVLDLQMVPQSAIVTNADYLRSLETLAELGLKAEKKRPGPLGWD
ncbi:CII family transcriptional regulator [Pseudomonas protegens]|uniref:CII family transcriptional regulator n=1 Tax=Pseudomonas protegens TaxID=380021 RepID=UPI001C69D2B0|nr:CII family transcriptional regulator [Pseudomonas protegens]MDP9511373.1 CII family transcriptional regulator [Pseudomonas protegens]QYM99526.1 transcriptional regulator [Pseudomonas protegens]